MQHRVLVQKHLVVFSFRCIRKNAFDQKVGNFDEVAVFHKVLDVIAAVAQDSLLTIDKTNGTHT